MTKKKTIALDKQVLGLIVPEQILADFELYNISETHESITIELRENKARIPAVLAGEDVVLDGFCNPIELQSFPQKGKATFIRLFRRRWKPRGKRKHYSNTYEFAQPGTKATRAFGAFLKAAFGHTPNRVQHACSDFMHSRK